MKKRVVAVVLIIVMFFSMCPIISSAAYDANIVVNLALSKVNTTFANGWCLRFVKEMFAGAYGFTSTACCAYKYGNSYIDSTSRYNIPLGASVFFAGSNRTCKDCGNKCGHIGIYVGDDYVVHGWNGRIEKFKIDRIINAGYPYRGWGWHGNVELNSSTETIPGNSSNPNDYPYPARNLFFTSPVQTGDDVKWVQSVLSKLGYSIAIDGSYGPSTRDAIKAFQRDHGLSVDGSCGPATRAKLLEEWNRVSGVVVVNKPTWATIKANRTEMTVGETISFEFDSDSADSYTIGIDCNNNRVLTETVGSNKSFSYTCAQTGNYSAYISATNSAGGLDSSRVYWTVKEKEITVYTITYNANGGSGGPSSQQKNKGQSLTISSEIPERSGYSFVGWSTSAISDEAQYIPGSTFEMDADTTLYAVWEMNVHEHNWIWITDKEATCTENGMRHQECECGATQNEEYIGVFHDFGEWCVVDRETEYPFTVTHQRTCSVCGETQQYLITATPGNPDEILYGDVNSDGIIDGLDATALLQYLAEWEVDIDFYAADVNADGVIDGLDATLLLQYLAEWDVILGSNK